MNIEFIDCNDGKKLESGDFIFFKCADGIGGFYKNLKIIELTLKDNEFIFKVENIQGYTYIKNTVTLINGNNLNFIEIKRGDIGVIRDTNGYKKFLVDYFLML